MAKYVDRVEFEDDVPIAPTIIIIYYIHSIISSKLVHIIIDKYGLLYYILLLFTHSRYLTLLFMINV